MKKEKVSIYKSKNYISKDMKIAILHVEHNPGHFDGPDSIVFQREFWKIVYIVSGNGILKINNQRHRVSPGFVCLIHPDDLTTMELTENMTLYNILFLKELIASDVARLYSAYRFFDIFTPEFKPEQSLNHFHLHLLDSNRNIYSLVKNMAYEYCHQDANSKELLRFQLLELMVKLSRQSAKQFASHRRIEIINVINAYLLRHFQEQLRIQRIADELGISRGHLLNLYRRKTGKTIGQNLLQIRMNEAKRLLMTTNLSTEKICYMSGFHDVCNFYKVFKREMNVTPGEFRVRN